MATKVLIAPLNWGLGHASRCVPLINGFLSKEWEVILLSDGASLSLLQKEFPMLKSYKLPGYDIKYPYKNAIFNMATQILRFWKAVKNENKRLKEIVAVENPDLIISDNRYGVYCKKVKSIFIGHQIKLKTGNSILSKLASYLNVRMIKRFDELWIPDFEKGKSLAGDLSVPIPGMNTVFIGPLSRFTRESLEVKYDLCVILSGPEPQRSLFESIITDQLSQLNESTVIVLGKMGESEDYLLNDRIRIISHLSSKPLNRIINQSSIVISRSGYSSIMDLMKLDKKAILIPTPGQTEQEYLMEHLASYDNFVFQKQDEINIPEALEKLAKVDSNSENLFDFNIENILLSEK